MNAKMKINARLVQYVKTQWVAINVAERVVLVTYMTHQPLNAKVS